MRCNATTYRLCLTRDKANQIPIEAPANYDPKHYELVARYIALRVAAGDKLAFGDRNGGPSAFLKMSVLPHGKTDVNESNHDRHRLRRLQQRISQRQLCPARRDRQGA